MKLGDLFSHLLGRGDPPPGKGPASTAPTETELSSNVRRIWYEAPDLHVIFRNNSHYVYRQVPYPIYKSMTTAGSPGRFVHRVLRPHYKAERLR